MAAPTAGAVSASTAAPEFEYLTPMLVMPFAQFKRQGRIMKSVAKWRDERRCARGGSSSTTRTRARLPSSSHTRKLFAHIPAHRAPSPRQRSRLASDADARPAPVRRSPHRVPLHVSPRHPLANPSHRQNTWSLPTRTDARSLGASPPPLLLPVPASRAHSDARSLGASQPPLLLHVPVGGASTPRAPRASRAQVVGSGLQGRDQRPERQV